MEKRVTTLMFFAAALFLVTAITVNASGRISSLSLRTSGTWHEFAVPRPAKKQPDKWVLVGQVTLKNKAAQHLDTLTARWEGKKLGKLSAALYSKKHRADQLIPIQENLICDGQWNSKKQEFNFPINKKLVATDTYYLVLSFPRNVEKTIQGGHFTFSKGNRTALLTLAMPTK